VDALLAALRERWQEMDEQERAFLLYCVQRLRQHISEAEEPPP
jgi:hypothetical protein